MLITFVTRKFGNVECNSLCDVLHITPIRVARLFLDCNGVFAIKAYGRDGIMVHTEACLKNTVTIIIINSIQMRRNKTKCDHLLC